MCEFGHCRQFFVVKQRSISKPTNISVFQHDDSPIDTQYPSFSHPFFHSDRLRVTSISQIWDQTVPQREVSPYRCLRRR
jgi:hypothetical protein